MIYDVLRIDDSREGEATEIRERWERLTGRRAIVLTGIEWMGQIEIGDQPSGS